MKIKGNKKRSILKKQAVNGAIKGKIIKRKDIEGKIITPKKPACDWHVVESWELDHYEPKAGKTVGVWPYDYFVSNLKTLRNKWGYSGITVGNHTKYNNAISAGYSTQNIMRDCGFNTGTKDYKNKINDQAGYYYIGEAVNHGCIGNKGKRLYSPDELESISSYIHEYRYGSKFVSDGYKRCYHFNVLAGIVDKIMFSSYKHWYKINIALCYTNLDWGPAVEDIWVPGSYDQRPDWSDMKIRYGSKFSMTWINTKEITEFDNLFGHAKNLGLNEVWIYGYIDEGQPVPHYNDEWENISYAAWQEGFLRLFRRKYYYYYHCLEPDPCNNCDNPEALWVLDHVLKTDEVKEFYP